MTPENETHLTALDEALREAIEARKWVRIEKALLQAAQSDLERATQRSQQAQAKLEQLLK